MAFVEFGLIALGSLFGFMLGDVWAMMRCNKKAHEIARQALQDERRAMDDGRQV